MPFVGLENSDMNKVNLSFGVAHIEGETDKQGISGSPEPLVQPGHIGQGRGCGFRKGDTREGVAGSDGPLRATGPSWREIWPWELFYQDRTFFS